jgi:nucleoside-diphosphate-sugar epimerase
MSKTQNMRIAILGATSQIARDLIVSLATAGETSLYLFARRPDDVKNWLDVVGISRRYPVNDFSDFGKQKFDAIINFVGASNPVQIVEMGSSIFDITLQFDEMALNYLKSHPACRYLFLSSGAAYGSNFNEPVTCNTPAIVAINNLSPQEWYGVAKLHAECRHRSHPELAIIDIRVFNYFSRTQDISARFLITDILRAIRDKETLKTSQEYIVRDFLHPLDFYKLVSAMLTSPATNAAVDAYSRAPIDKPDLLAAMQEKFGLRYEITTTFEKVNTAEGKTCYYSLNTRAADFGYQPSLTSLEGIVQDSEKILKVQA